MCDPVDEHDADGFPKYWIARVCQNHHCDKEASYWCKACGKYVCGVQCYQCCGADKNWWRPRSHYELMHRPMRALLPYDVPPPPLDWLPEGPMDEERDVVLRFRKERETLHRLALMCERLQSRDDHVVRLRTHQLGPLLQDITWLQGRVTDAINCHIGLEPEFGGGPVLLTSSRP